MSSIKLKGSLSGEVTLRAADEAGDTVLDLPIGSGKLYHSASPPGLREIIAFTSSGVFEKVDYPWLRAVRVRMVGGGGGGSGSAATASGEYSVGHGGSGAEYREGFWNADELPASITCTVGAGGAAASAGSVGNDGGDSSFGELMTAVKGVAGTILTTNLTGGWFTAEPPIPPVGGGGYLGTRGDSCTYGGKVGDSSGPSRLLPSSGGGSVLGSGGSGQQNGSGRIGRGYGAGGGGSANNQGNAARTGSAGTSGIIVVELFG
jgi:hypothetical protein